MKHHLQAILVVLALFIAVLGVVDVWTLPHSLPHFAAAWVTDLDAATVQLSHAQTPDEVLGALVYATAVAALPCGYAVFAASCLLMVAMRLLGFIVGAIVRKAVGR